MREVHRTPGLRQCCGGCYLGAVHRTACGPLQTGLQAQQNTSTLDKCPFFSCRKLVVMVYWGLLPGKIIVAYATAMENHAKSLKVTLITPEGQVTVFNINKL